MALAIGKRVRVKENHLDDNQRFLDDEGVIEKTQSGDLPWGVRFDIDPSQVYFWRADELAEIRSRKRKEG